LYCTKWNYDFSDEGNLRFRHNLYRTIAVKANGHIGVNLGIVVLLAELVLKSDDECVSVQARGGHAAIGT